MLVLSILMYIAGAGSLIYGIYLNNDVSSRLTSFFSSGSTDPGTVFIGVGIVLLIIATILLVVHSGKNKKKADQ